MRRVSGRAARPSLSRATRARPTEARAGQTMQAPWPNSCGCRDIDQRDKQVFQAGVMLAILLAQFGQSALRDEPSRGDDADPVGHSFGDFENVRGHDYGAAGADAIIEQSLDMPG